MARWFGLAVGVVSALAPTVVAAQEGTRALDTPEDATTLIAITLAAVVAIFVVSGLGYLYRRERKLDWDFQRDETPRLDDHH